MQTSVVKAVETAATVLRACEAVGIHDPAEIQPLAEFAQAAEERETALIAHRRAVGAHARFSSTHSHEDPAHEDHQRAVVAAKATLDSAEVLLAEKRAEWRKARGL